MVSYIYKNLTLQKTFLLQNHPLPPLLFYDLLPFPKSSFELLPQGYPLILKSGFFLLHYFTFLPQSLIIPTASPVPHSAWYDAPQFQPLETPSVFTSVNS